MSYFGARYYDSDLSIWLSADPLADKRPWESPYSYCGNNPIRRVDPTGMIWEDGVDQQQADDMIQKATTQRSTKQDRLNNLSNTADPTTRQKNEMKQLTTEIGLLTEGIDGLEAMGADENQLYHFNKVEGNQGSVTKREDGVINLNYIEGNGNTEGYAWHEAIHTIRSRNNPGDWGWNGNRLATSNLCGEEYRAYYSQWVFSPNSMNIFNNGTSIKSPADLKMYLGMNKQLRNCGNFKMP